MVLLKMRGVSLFIVIILFQINLVSEPLYTIDKSVKISAAYYFPDHKGFDLSGDFTSISYSKIAAESENERDLGSTWGGAELLANYNIDLTRDFLAGGTALTKDNSLKHTLSFGLSPVDLNFKFNNTIKPIAFLEFSLGSNIATGWKAIGVDGLALYTDPLGANDSAFQGIYSKTWLSGTFQFDTAALLKGDRTWKHIILLSNHNLYYRNFSAAGSDDPWIYQGAHPEYNGFKYEQSSLIGYQMPLFLSMTGILFETKSSLFDNATRSTIKDGGWGSDSVEVKLGVLFNFKVDDITSFVILPQVIRNVRYTEGTVKESYFINRKADTDNPYYWDFYRVAFTFNYKL